MFELAYPLFLWLLLLPPLVWLVLPKTKTQIGAALKVPFYHLLVNEVGPSTKAFLPFLANLWFYLIWFCLVFALAQPKWIGEPIPMQREGRNLMLVLDISGSMEINDMLKDGQPLNRLNVVKLAAKEFVHKRAGDKLGLILFGSQAYLQTPLTYDRQTILDRIDDATVGLAGKNTSIGDAIGLAVKRLRDVPAKSRVIILLTDGANNDGILSPDKATELAKEEGIKIYTIGLGSEQDPRAMSNPFFALGAGAYLDEETLKKIAAITGGKYFKATDAQSLQSIYDLINQMETVKQQMTNLRPQITYYPWFLVTSLALIALWFWVFRGKVYA